MDFQHLNVIKRREAGPDAIPCVALVHNERNILGEFLDHYRGLGPMAFYMVDDRSDDGSREFLADQPDVTLFAPKDGSTYAEHKRQWRSEILDRFADDRWCLAPDIDEHLVYRDFETRPLARLIKDLEAEGAQAMHCIMLDMYADKPLGEHVYAGGGLLNAFPYFDAPDAYYLMPAASRFRRAYPTPFLMVHGGMRDRMFIAPNSRPSALQRALLARFCRVDQPLDPSPARKVILQLVRRLTKSLRSGDPFTCTKLALVKWRKGLRFSGGSHAISAPVRLASERAALLHFKFTKGVDGIAYTAERGQHAGGAVFYNTMLAMDPALAATPVYEQSIRYDPKSSAQFL